MQAPPKAEHEKGSAEISELEWESPEPSSDRQTARPPTIELPPGALPSIPPANASVPQVALPVIIQDKEPAAAGPSATPAAPRHEELEAEMATLRRTLDEVRGKLQTEREAALTAAERQVELEAEVESLRESIRRDVGGADLADRDLELARLRGEVATKEEHKRARGELVAAIRSRAEALAAKGREAEVSLAKARKELALVQSERDALRAELERLRSGIGAVASTLAGALATVEQLDGADSTVPTAKGTGDDPR
jgi:hypothetical protein